MIETKTVSPDTNQTQQSPKSCTTTTRATRTYLTVSTLIDASDTLMTVTVALPSRTWRNLWGNVEDTVTIADETYRVDHWEVCDLQLFDVADVRIDLTSDSAMRDLMDSLVFAMWDGGPRIIAIDHDMDGGLVIVSPDYDAGHASRSLGDWHTLRRMTIRKDANMRPYVCWNRTRWYLDAYYVCHDIPRLDLAKYALA